MALRQHIRRGIMLANCLAPVAFVGLAITGHFWLGVGIVLFAHALWLVPTLWPACDWYGVVVRTLPASAEKEVWLTIDDGPDTRDTAQLLDLLDTHGAKATFFFIGAKAALNPDLVREVVRRGHTVGNHTMTHPQYWYWAYGPMKARQEIQECQRTLTDACGIAPHWFRAPAGLKNPFVQSIVEQENLRLACWSARGLDGVDADKARVIERITRAVQPGGIILMHEGRADLEGRRLAPQVLEEVLLWLRANGYRCVIPE